MKRAFNIVWKLIVSIIICAAAGFLLLFLAFAIPSDKIESNIKDSVRVFQIEGSYPYVDTICGSHILDNYTDALMLLSAGYSGDESLIDRAVNVYHAEISDLSPAHVIVELYYGHGSDAIDYVSYGRYWHGYLILLRPLLYLFDYEMIRSLNSYLMIVVAGILIFLLFKKNMKWYIFPYLISLFLLDPFAISFSLQYSSVYYITSLSSILLLLKIDKWGSDIGKYAILFAVTGCLTSYFDLLTYPLVTLGIPITLYLCHSNDSLKDELKTLLCLSGSWGIGYSCMWALKWIIGGLLTSENIINNALSSAAFRISNSNASGMSISLLDVFNRNFEQLESPVGLIALIYMIFLVITLIAHIKAISSHDQILCGLLFIFVGIMPIVWYAILSNHSYIHSFFTYRELTISVFALLCMLTKYVSMYDHKKRKIKKA